MHGHHNNIILRGFKIVKEVAKELFLEVIGEQCVEMSQGLIRAAKHYLDQSGRIAGEMLVSELNPLVR
jgi:hypothetical protein